ncbi:hypothetical protein QFC22_004087 [Naganishia vaughanmartiniae]|uniref:Uncharacterized protein n=1 Tax=Naganishia vaughanmartiniae TaxID=1424756 RepID=A0ACC2X344_9TREE|nr:hypothetical protein QFC22_004087 [Naganishia vaughanmartiniae]
MGNQTGIATDGLFFSVCYAIQLKILEYGDRPDVLERLAKRTLEDSNDDASGTPGEDTRGEGTGSRGRGGHRGSGGGAGRGRGRGGAAAATGAMTPDRSTEQDPPASKKAKVESAAAGNEA